MNQDTVKIPAPKPVIKQADEAKASPPVPAAPRTEAAKAPAPKPVAKQAKPASPPKPEAKQAAKADPKSNLKKADSASYLFRVKKYFTQAGFKQKIIWLCVYLPTLLAGLYLFFIHSSMYLSETRFALRSNDSSDLPSITGMIFQTASTTTMDTYVVQEYIVSPDMLQKVMDNTPFLEHYSGSPRDIYSRLKSSPSREELLEYWHWIVSVNFNPDKGIITVETKAYSPEMAQLVNQVILGASEELVNRMNDRAHHDSLRLTQEEVSMAEKRLLNAQSALQQFRDDKSILDPLTTARGLETVIAQLESEAASTQADLSATLQVMNPDSPRVISIRTRLNALQEQLAKEKARLAGLSSQQDALSSLVGNYAQLATEERFAQEQYIKAMVAFEAARIKAISQSRYIVPFQQPTLPQESLYPRPLLYTVFIGLALLVLLGIVSLIIAAIKDHMGV